MVLNCGDTPVPLPEGEVLIASGPVDDKLPADTAVWLRRPVPEMWTTRRRGTRRGGAAPEDVSPDHLRVGWLLWIRQQPTGHFLPALATGC